MPQSYAPIPRFTTHCVLTIRGEPSDVATGWIVLPWRAAAGPTCGGDIASSIVVRRQNGEQRGEYGRPSLPSPHKGGGYAVVFAEMNHFAFAIFSNLRASTDQ